MSIDTETNRKTAENLVRNEVIYCVSRLISDALDSGWSTFDHPLDELLDVATNTDYCEAAVVDFEYRYDSSDFSDPEFAEREDLDKALEWANDEGVVSDDMFGQDDIGAMQKQILDTLDEDNALARSYCRELDVDCDDCIREVFEHWIVSDFLADNLEALGESVARDWHGLTIWGRLTTGQAIAMDHVMLKVADRLNKSTKGPEADDDG